MSAYSPKMQTNSAQAK